MIKLLKLLPIMICLLTCGRVYGAPFHVETEDGTIKETTEKVAHISGEINEQSLLSFTIEMARTADRPGDRVVVINSTGGFVEAGEKMLTQLESEQARGVRIVCFVRGQAASMAFNILTRCDRRIATKNSSLMFHWSHLTKVETLLETPLTYKRLEALAKDLKDGDDKWHVANIKALKLEKVDYELFADNDRDWTAKDMYALGYLHGLVQIAVDGVAR